MSEFQWKSLISYIELKILKEKENSEFLLWPQGLRMKSKKVKI